MARLAAILGAVSRALRRDQKSIWSVVGNNFFIASAAVLQDAGTFIYLTIGIVILFPLSTDPLRKIPASRFSLWPLDRRERWILRLASPWVNPMTWAIAALAFWAAHGKVTFGLWALAAGLVIAGFIVSSLPLASGRTGAGMWRRIPNFPGPLNHLIRKNLREILSTLDIYCALLLSLSTLAFRVALPALPREALIAVTVLVVVALSSYAQSLFGLDGTGGLSRYRLLPLPGWQVLAAKDLAFLLAVVPLTLPLAPLAGLGGALAALAVGHENSVNAPRAQVRWRFSTGGVFLMKGLTQVVIIGMAASSIFLSSPLFLLPCIAGWAGSLWWYGHSVERVFGDGHEPE
jgi:hypothetical protein